MITVALMWEIFDILEYFNGTTCLMVYYVTLINKKMLIFVTFLYKTCYNYTLNSCLFHFWFLIHPFGWQSELCYKKLGPNGFVRGQD